MSTDNTDVIQTKVNGSIHTNGKGFLGTRQEQVSLSSRLENQTFGSRQRVGPPSDMPPYYEDSHNPFPDFGNDEYGGGMDGSFNRGQMNDYGFGKSMQYNGNRMLSDMNKDMKMDHNKDIEINPFLYKQASKPPIIREGDWLCPDIKVYVYNIVL